MALFDQIKKMRQDRAKLVADAGKILEEARTEKRELTPEESERFDTIQADVEEMKGRIDRLETQYDAEASLEGEGEGASDGDRSTPEVKETRETKSRVLRSFILGQTQLLKPEEVKLGQRMGLDFSKQALNFRFGRTPPPTLRDAREARALSVGTTTAGGFTVEDDNSLMSQLEVSMLAFGGMREHATVIRTEDGGDLPMPNTNDTGNVGAILAENTQASEQDVAFTQLVLEAYKYSSKLVRVSVELLQDAAVNIESLLGELLGERIARILNTHFTTGTGSSQPNGVVTAAGSTAAASATAIVRDDIVNLLHAVDPAYRANARFMLHDTVLAYLKKLTVGSSDDRPLWQPGMAVGEPDRIEGLPYVINQDMPNTMTTGLDIMVCGDLSKYLIRDVLDVQVLVLRERYADYHQVGFLAFSRHDGDLRDAGTDPVKVLTMA